MDILVSQGIVFQGILHIIWQIGRVNPNYITLKTTIIGGQTKWALMHITQRHIPRGILLIRKNISNSMSIIHEDKYTKLKLKAYYFKSDTEWKTYRLKTRHITERGTTNEERYIKTKAYYSNDDIHIEWRFLLKELIT